MLEDEPADAELIERELHKAGLAFTAERVDTRAAFIAALDRLSPDILLADFDLPDFNGGEALAHVRQAHPEVPVVMVTDALGDEAAAKLLQAGAKDYVLKDHLVRLAPAIERAVEVEQGVRARKAAEREMRESEAKYRSLVEQNVAGIVIIRADGTIGYVNPYFAHLTGYDIPELVGRPIRDILTDDEREVVAAELGAEFSADTPFVQRQSAVKGKDGRRRDVLISASPSTFEAHPASIAVIVDVTERRQAADALRRSHELLAATERIGHVGGFVLDRKDKELVWSEEVYRIYGRATSDGPPNLDAFIAAVHPDDRKRISESLDAIWQTTERVVQHFRIVRPDGGERYLRAESQVECDAAGAARLIRGMVQDVTETNKSTQELAFERAVLATEHELSPDGILVVDDAGRIASINHRFIQIFRVPSELTDAKADEPLLRWVSDQIDDSEAFLRRIRYLYGHPTETSDEEIVLRDGRVFDRHSAPMMAADGRYLGRTWFFRDITERKRADDRIREEEAKFRGLVEQNLAGTIIMSPTGFIEYANPYFMALTGYDPEQVMGHLLTDFLPPAERPTLVENLRTQSLDPSKQVSLPTVIQAKDGRLIEVVVNASSAVYQAKPAVIGVVLDITELRRAERTLRRLNRTLKTLSAGDEVLVRAATETDLLREMCRVVVDVGGYRMAWIGVPQKDVVKSVRPVAWAGAVNDYLATVEITWADDPRGQGPTSRAVRTGDPQIVRSVASDPSIALLRAAAERQGFASVVAFPLKDASGVFAVLTIDSAETDAFDAEEMKLLQELATDLAYGVGVLRDRGAHESLERRWRTSLEATVTAIASTVEARDPYTAGHQRRVAQLSVAIGRKLAMSDDDLQGLYLAAAIHDVGKIVVPAELLSKPGKLSEPEFQLIQGHVQAGYNIVKNIDFPWPVAEMIRQHHERLNGSGYPRGLKGDTMLAGAKILMVADVVEAMMLHRPYRVALGLEAALAEIEKGRGILFDPAAVDACIALFREGGFHFD